MVESHYTTAFIFKNFLGHYGKQELTLTNGVKVLVSAFNQGKALEGVFSVIIQL